MTIRFGLTTAIVAAVTVLALAACSEEPEGSPDATTPAVTTPSLPDSGAPRVENPLVTASFEAKPCSVTPPAELKKAGMDFRKSEAELDSAFGPACDWFYRQEGYGVAGGRFTAISNRGLSEIYDQRDEWVVFEELTIAGYPAVIYDDIERQSPGFCTLPVGVRDDKTYVVTASLSTPHPDVRNPCKVAKEFAEIAVETMKRGQG